VQSTDAGKLYHKGVLLALILLGKRCVPGVPQTARQARAVLKFVAQLLDIFVQNPKWCAPLGCSEGPPAPVRADTADGAG